VRILPCGDSGLLVEVDGLTEVLTLADGLRAAPPRGVLDVVPAARTVLLVLEPGTDLAEVRRAVLALRVVPAVPPPVGDAVDIARVDIARVDIARVDIARVDIARVDIAVVYDGPDLDEVGALTGLGAVGVVAAHTSTPWRVAFGGFVPGFAYLAGGDVRLAVPRRSEPRTRVPPGAVGLAGEFSGIYPRASPGGWQLIGHTDAPLWTESGGALLRPGTRVRFVDAAVAEPGADAQEPDPGVRTAPTGTGTEVGRRGGLEVARTGALALVQDLGRPGSGATGVGRSGAADRGALRLANRLVANAEDAAGIEVVFGGLSVRSGALHTVALAGAPAPADVDGTPVGHHAVVVLRPGQVLTLGAPPTGLRTYLAVRGGVDVMAVLGSRSTDTLSGVGPPRITPGVVLPVGPEPPAFPIVDVAPVGVPSVGTVTLRAVLGPRADRVADPAALARATWTASSRSDRVGVRLEGERLDRTPGEELPSEGMVRGAVQVPPGGEPVLFLADHPVTGGYPVVAVVLDADVDRAAQLRPGQRVRFVLVEPGHRTARC